MRKLSALQQQVLLETFTLGVNSGAGTLQKTHKVNFEFSLTRFDVLEKKYALAALAPAPDQNAQSLSRNFSSATGGMLLLLTHKSDNNRVLDCNEFRAVGEAVLDSCIKTLEYLFEQDAAASLSIATQGSWKNQLQQCHYLTDSILVAPIRILNKTKNNDVIAYLIFDLESMDEFQTLVNRYISSCYSMQNSG